MAGYKHRRRKSHGHRSAHAKRDAAAKCECFRRGAAVLYAPAREGFDYDLGSGSVGATKLESLLVLDRSGSMGSSGSNSCPIRIAAAQSFVTKFTDGFDTRGLITF